MKRPVRDRVEESLEQVDSGPLGKVGQGNVLGAAGFLAVESTRPFIEFIPGIKQPGYSVTAHGTEDMGGYTEHRITVNAISEDVAQFAAQYAAAPSNIDYVTTATKVTDIETVQERSTYSTWHITVEVDERGELE